jgi:AcrR family transcriptional regulator
VKESLTRGEGRKRVIAEAALELFLERGFGPVTVEDVAKSADASKQTIYRFFGDRLGLIAFCLTLELERTMAPLRDATRSAPSDPARIERVASAFQQLVFDDRGLRIYRFILGEVSEHPELGRTFTALVTDEVVSLVSAVLRDEFGWKREPLDLATDVFLGTLQGKELNRALAGFAPRPERLAALRGEALRALRAR